MYIFQLIIQLAVWANEQFTLEIYLQGIMVNYGGCIHQKKYPVQADEYNYHDSLQGHLIFSGNVPFGLSLVQRFLHINLVTAHCVPYV